MGSLMLLFSAPEPLSNKVFCFASTYVSWDNSFLSVTQKPLLKSWERSFFLQQIHSPIAHSLALDFTGNLRKFVIALGTALLRI